MMGQLPPDQNTLFYDFCLENYVPQDHLLRRIDPFLDLTDLREHLAAHYSHTGRPSVDPEVMIRMLIVGYCYGIRSERRLCEEVHLNLAYRWFCRLGLEGKVPDHSTFSENRHGRFRESDTFRQLFELVLQRCMTEGLVGGEGFATDASIVKADASRQYHRDDDDDWGGGRAVREYLEAIDEDNTQTKATRKVSPTDPAASYTAAPGGPAFYAYSTNYLIDTKGGIIMDVEATPANRTFEVDSARTMMERVEDRFELKPAKLIGDTAYGKAELLGWLVDEQGITPHIPVWDKSEEHDEIFGRSVFTWDAEADRYLCPGGKELLKSRRKFKKKRTHVTKAKTIIYRASKKDCDHCAMKMQCCPGNDPRKIARSIHEDARDLARALETTEEFAASANERKKVEMLFGHMKKILKVDRLRLRGLSGVTGHRKLTLFGQNY